MANESCSAAVLAFADIKAAVEDFDRGESNLFAALKQIETAISLLAREKEPRRDAA